MNKVRRVDFYPDEWLQGTARLKPMQIAVYITACAMIYSEGRPIEKNDLRDAIKCPGPAFEEALTALQKRGKLSVEGSLISSKRCAEELQKAFNRIEKAAQNGGKGGRPSNQINDLGKPAGFYDGKLTINYQPPTTNQLDPNGSYGTDVPVDTSQPAHETEPEPTAPTRRKIAEQMVSIWNEVCGDILANPQRLSNRRINQCSARLKELDEDLDEWRELCRRIRRSSFLTGEKDFKAHFDWVLKESNFVKIIEGNYDNRIGNLPLNSFAGGNPNQKFSGNRSRRGGLATVIGMLNARDEMERRTGSKDIVPDEV